MSGNRSGQILYLAGSTSSHNSPGGSLSTRFQKLAQARSSGITVVNSTSTSSIQTRSGTALGLGRNTGSRPTGPGQRIVTNNNNNNNNPNKGKKPAGLGPGLHTAGGLARAMQERGTGVTDEFLLAPKLHLTPGGEDNGRGGGAVRRRGRGAGPGAGPSNQANRHKSMVLGSRPTRQQKQNSSVSQPPPPSAQQQQPSTRGAKTMRGGRGGKAARGGKNANGATAAGAGAAAGGSKPKPQGKNKKSAGGAAAAAGASEKGKDKSKPNADKLDSELSEYMMKDEHTAASLLDNDLDMYMADRPEDGVW